MKKTKFLALALILVTLISSFAVFSIGASAAEAWDGVTADIGWYVKDSKATEFTISTPAELFGLSVICFSCDKSATPTGEAKVYYDDNDHAILSADKINDRTKTVEGSKFAGKTVKLASDIDLGGKAFIPIGNTGSFQGVFDGQNHKVTNLYVDSASAQHKGFKAPNEQYYFGLFAFIAKGAVIKNVTLENAVFDVNMPDTALHCYVGAIVGAINNDASLIQSCKADNIKVNFSHSDAFNPGQNTGTGDLYCLIGAAIGRLGSYQEQSVVVTGFELNAASSEKYSQSEDVIYGGLTAVTVAPAFKDSSVTYKDGKVVTPGAVAEGDSASTETIPPPEDDAPEGDIVLDGDVKPTTPQTSAPATSEAAADSTTAAGTDDGGSGNTAIIIIAAAAVVIVVGVIVFIVLKKKKA